jgi:hypothetical protein
MGRSRYLKLWKLCGRSATEQNYKSREYLIDVAEDVGASQLNRGNDTLRALSTFRPPGPVKTGFYSEVRSGEAGSLGCQVQSREAFAHRSISLDDHIHFVLIYRDAKRAGGSIDGLHLGAPLGQIIDRGLRLIALRSPCCDVAQRRHLPPHAQQRIDHESRR